MRGCNANPIPPIQVDFEGRKLLAHAEHRFSRGAIDAPTNEPPKHGEIRVTFDDSSNLSGEAANRYLGLSHVLLHGAENCFGRTNSGAPCGGWRCVTCGPPRWSAAAIDSANRRRGRLAKPVKPAPPIDRTAFDDCEVRTKWERLEVAKSLVRGGDYDRQSKCHKTRIRPDAEPEIRRYDSGAYSLSDLMTCRNWCCAVCGTARGRDTAGALAVIFRRHLAPARSDESLTAEEVDALRRTWVERDVWMLTMTAPHTAVEDPRTVVQRLYKASERFFRSRAWRRFADRHGIEYRVRVLDCTHGGCNGAHPHFHVALLPTRAQIPLWYVEPDAPAGAIPFRGIREATEERRALWLDTLVGGLVPAWEDAVIDAGTSIDKLTQFREQSLMLSGAEKAAGYFAKWGLADEIGASTAKSRSHLRLLDAAAAGIAGAGAAYIAWRAASDGVAWVTGLERAKDAYGVDGDAIAEYLAELRSKRRAEAEKKGEPIPVVVRAFQLKIRSHLYAGALRSGWPDVFAFLDEIDAAGGRDLQSELDGYLWRARGMRLQGRSAPSQPP